MFALRSAYTFYSSIPVKDLTTPTNCPAIGPHFQYVMKIKIKVL